MNNSPQHPALSPEEIAALNEAFGFLYTDLREAKHLFERGEYGGREGAIHAVETITKFLSRFQPVLDEGLNAPLLGLLNALHALDGIDGKPGKTLPILVPRGASQGGRRHDSPLHNSVKGSAVFTVERLQNTNLSRGDALRRVVSVLRKEGIPSAQGAVNLRTLREWKDAIDADRHSEAAQTYHALVAKFPLENLRGRDVVQIRSLYLKEFADQIRKTRAAEVPTRRRS
jgi:hypothetical protein